MQATSVTANLRVTDIESARDFYTEFLGLRAEAFNLGWVTRLESPDGAASVQLVTKDETAPQDSIISVKTHDIEQAYDEAKRRGYEIVHPLVTEEWGVRRFFVRAPDGNVINIARHHDED